MSMQIYRLAVSAAKEFGWQFHNSDSEDVDKYDVCEFHQQDKLHRDTVQREVAKVEAYKYTMEFIYNHVLDRVLAMADLVLR